MYSLFGNGVEWMEIRKAISIGNSKDYTGVYKYQLVLTKVIVQTEFGPVFDLSAQLFILESSLSGVLGKDWVTAASSDPKESATWVNFETFQRQNTCNLHIDTTFLSEKVSRETSPL